MSAATSPPPPVQRPRAGRLARLAGWSTRHGRLAVLLWVVAVVAISVAAGAVGSDYRNDFSLPGTESQRAADLLAAHGAAGADDSLQVVVESEDGLRAPRVRDEVDSMLEELSGLPSVASVTSPYDDPGAIAPDGRIGYATVGLTAPSEAVPAADVRRIVDTAQAADGDGLRVELAGEAVRGAEEGGGGAGEGAGILAALVILVFLFGSIVAASLPLLTALFAVAGALGLIGLSSHLATVADFTEPIMILVGLGVGIDYALLIFSRYRAELLDGADPGDAAVTALDAAGRTVLFAGCTVIVALLGLVVLGLGSLQGVAVALALTVAMTLLSALTLLPALLGLLGGRIRRQVLKRAERRGGEEHARWAAWARAVQRRPWPPLVAALALTVALCLPALDLRLGFADAGTDPPSSTSRQAYDLLAQGFGAGSNGPLVVVSEGGGERAAAALQRVLAETPGVAHAGQPVTVGDGAVSLVIAIPDSAPQSEATKRLVERLRGDVLAPLEARTGATYLVGGATAAAVDFSDKVAARMPLFVAIVVGLSSLLLLAIFRSLLIPVKAAVLNLLSIGAALGVITLVFGDGLLGAQPGPVEAFLPVMIFAIVFGLSMDYEVFLVSRIHEQYRRHGDASRAVTEGLASTGRVISAAAAIMVVVFAAFLLSPSRMLQQFGLGLATAILLDALVIRCLVVPAVMQLLGDRAWWLPRPLRRIVPRLALEPGEGR